MGKKKVEILVACHKPDTVYRDDVYTPIHVGRAISKYTAEMNDFIGDNTGDNISEKNASYCELTAQYWAWKNIHDVEYIGLCHYRRYFKKLITNENVGKELAGYDMIVASHILMPKNIKSWLCGSLTSEDVYILYQVLIKRNPEAKDVIDEFFAKKNSIYPCNMFLCSKSLFDEFAKWQFGILQEVELNVIPSGYTRLKRLYGYLAEALLNLYILLKGLKVKEMSLVSMIGDEKAIMKSTFLQDLKTKIRFMLQPHDLNWDYALIAGLKADGIYNKVSGK